MEGLLIHCIWVVFKLICIFRQNIHRRNLLETFQNYYHKCSAIHNISVASTSRLLAQIIDSSLKTLFPPLPPIIASHDMEAVFQLTLIRWFILDLAVLTRFTWWYLREALSYILSCPSISMSTTVDLHGRFSTISRSTLFFQLEQGCFMRNLKLFYFTVLLDLVGFFSL